jgi:FixJ family two-component response regulator
MTEDAMVYVIDDEEALRKSVRRLLEQVDLEVETFASVDGFLQAYTPGKPGCLVLDVRMPGTSGIDLQKKLADDGIDVPVIIVTGHGDIQMAVDAMRRGAVDFLEKPYRAQALLDSIHRALDGDRSRRRQRCDASRIAERFARLTAREREVVDLVVGGKTNKEIASGVGVTPQAIDARRARAMAKLGVRTVPQLVEYVLRHTWSEQGYALPALEERRTA